MGMFGQAKPTASLSSTLLARKGQATPAMRRQGSSGFDASSGAQDDLGWNDMGYEGGQDGGRPAEPPAPAVPPVLVQREALREEFAAPPAPAPEPAQPAVEQPIVVEETPLAPTLKPVSVATATRIGRETGKKHGRNHPRSAFTLRLDQDRHLRLRLASALHDASAQVLVTAALDQFLQTMPEVDALVRQLPARTGR